MNSFELFKKRCTVINISGSKVNSSCNAWCVPASTSTLSVHLTLQSTDRVVPGILELCSRVFNVQITLLRSYHLRHYNHQMLGVSELSCISPKISREHCMLVNIFGTKIKLLQNVWCLECPREHCNVAIASGTKVNSSQYA